MREWIPAAALAAALMLYGCGKQEGSETASADTPADNTEEAAAPAGPALLEACKLTMTAPVANQWTTMWDPAGRLNMGEGPSHAHTPHWATPEEREKYFTGKNLMLDLTCAVKDENGDNVFAIMIAAPTSTDAEVPFAPGTYRIVWPGEGKETAPGEFVASWILFDNGMFVNSSGTLRIDRFDTNGVAGSFDVKAEEPFGAKRPLAVSGTFDIPCRGGPPESACTANKAVRTE